jgi:cell division protein FtsL
MGLPALKHDHRTEHKRPHLRVVRPELVRKPGRSRQAANAGAHQAFMFFAVFIVVVAVLGLGRVWLSVQAAQASIDSGKIRTAIKAARYEGDMLEIQQSALATPSRIQAIAVGTMGMAPATSVSYLEMRDVEAAPTSDTAVKPATAVGSKVMEQVMTAAAGEARMLLVGDVGLSSSR